MVERAVMNLAGISSWWAWRRYEWKRRHVYVCKSKDVFVNFSLIAPYSVNHFLWSYFHISFAFKWLWSVKIRLLKFLDPKRCANGSTFWPQLSLVVSFPRSFLIAVCTRGYACQSLGFVDFFSPFGPLYGWFCLSDLIAPNYCCPPSKSKYYSATSAG